MTVDKARFASQLGSGVPTRVNPTAATLNEAQAAAHKQNATMAKVAELISSEKVHSTKWSMHYMQQVRAAIMAAIQATQVRAEVADPNNRYAMMQAVENAKEQLRRMLATLNPPKEISESGEWLSLSDALKATGKGDEDSGFQRDSGIKGAVKDAIAQGRIAEAVREADTTATQKRVRAQKEGEMVAQGFARMSLAQLAKALKQKLRKQKKPKVDEVVDDISTAEPEDVTRAEITAFAQAAFDTMKALREEIAPKWAPDQQPWLVSSGDREVFDIVLAIVPKELLQETQAWGQIQDLRKGDQLFTFRAEDKLGEALKRT